MKLLVALAAACMVSGCALNCAQLDRASAGIGIAEGALHGAANAGSVAAGAASDAAARPAQAARVAIEAARKAKHCTPK